MQAARMIGQMFIGIQDDTGNGNDHVFREIPDHIENAAVPRLRHCADFTGDAHYSVIDSVKQTTQVTHDAADQQVLQPLDDRV